jgi:hypothetical protein
MESVGMFETAPGNTSSTRVMFVVGLSWSMLLTSLGAFILKWTPGEIIAVFSALSGVFVALKLVQKPMENKDTPPVVDEVKPTV